MWKDSRPSHRCRQSTDFTRLSIGRPRVYDAAACAGAYFSRIEGAVGPHSFLTESVAARTLIGDRRICAGFAPLAAGTRSTGSGAKVAARSGYAGTTRVVTHAEIAEAGQAFVAASVRVAVLALSAGRSIGR